MTYSMDILLDSRMDPIYRAAVEATEEAILNALCAAVEMDGIDGRRVPELPMELVAEMIKHSRKACRTQVDKSP
jgi:D-aminopeptidase